MNLFNNLFKNTIHFYNWLRVKIVIVSYPKCGRTWLRVMIGKYLKEKFCPNFPERLIPEVQLLSKKLKEVPYIMFTHAGNPHLHSCDEIRINKWKYTQKKVVFLIRDPRDVIVSNYFQSTKRDNNFSGDISTFIRKKRGGINSVICFYNKWGEFISNHKFSYILKYEDLQKNPMEELKKLLIFIGIPIECSILEEVTTYAKFENMRKMEEKNFFKNKRLEAKNIDDIESFKVRKGIVGGYKEYLSSKDIKYIDNLIQNKLIDLYKFYKNDSSER